jgi:DNA-binding GntR family transcriptional regulator
MEREFKAILLKMKLAVMNSDSKTYSQCNTEFHRHLFKLANSNILMRLYEQLGHPLKFLLDISTRSRSDMDVSFAEHVAIVENLQGKEIDRAKALLTANVRHGLDRVLTTRSNLPK